VWSLAKGALLQRIFFDTENIPHFDVLSNDRLIIASPYMGFDILTKRRSASYGWAISHKDPLSIMIIMGVCVLGKGFAVVCGNWVVPQKCNVAIIKVDKMASF
jgi:hypothetical protein